MKFHPKFSKNANLIIISLGQMDAMEQQLEPTNNIWLVLEALYPTKPNTPIWTETPTSIVPTDPNGIPEQKSPELSLTTDAMKIN